MFDDASYRNDHFKTGGLSGSQYLASSPVATTANNRRVCHCQQDRRSVGCSLPLPPTLLTCDDDDDDDDNNNNNNNLLEDIFVFLPFLVYIICMFVCSS